jgi:hypothetical protein
MTSPKVQIRCDSCNTKYNFALPPSVLDNPSTPIRFRCSVCAYRFNIEPDKLLAQQGAAVNVIRVKKDDSLHIHQEISEVQLKIDSNEYEPTNVISTFGADWIMLSEHPELKLMSTGEDLSDDISPEEDDESYNDEVHEVVEAEDLSSEQQDWSQLDPFSESEEANSNAFDDEFDSAIEESEFEDFSEVESKPEEPEEAVSVEPEEVVAVEPEEVVAVEPEEVVAVEPEEVAAVEPEEIVAVEPEEVVAVEPEEVEEDYSNELPDEEYEESVYDEVFSQNDDEESSPEETKFGFVEEEEVSGVEDMFQWKENNMDEEDMLDSSEGVEDEKFMETIWDAYDSDMDEESSPEKEEEPQPVNEYSPEVEEEIPEKYVYDENAGVDTSYKEINFLDEEDLEKSITAAIEEADFQQDDDEFSLVDGKDTPDEDVDVEIEYEQEEEDNEEAIAEEEDSEEEEGQPIPTSESESSGSSERLSFHDKDSYLDEEEIKKELNPMWIMALLLLSAIGVLVYMNSRKQGDYAEVKGLTTNPDELNGEANENEGLQETTSDAESGSTSKEESAQDSDAEIEDDLNIEQDETNDDISRRGWQALNTNNADVAIQLFKVVLQRQPDHFYSSAGLGRAYESLGQVELAGRQYCNAAGIPSIDYDDMQYWLGYAEQVGTFCQ